MRKNTMKPFRKAGLVLIKALKTRENVKDF